MIRIDEVTKKKLALENNVFAFKVIEIYLSPGSWQPFNV